MISANAKTIQKSFTEQAQNFETKSMNFTKQEYLEHMISCVKPQKTDTVLEVAAKQAAKIVNSTTDCTFFQKKYLGASKLLGFRAVINKMYYFCV